jgi:DNA polymerase-3 subunit chi
MTSYSFYQISKSPIDKIIPSLLFKIYSTLKKPMIFIVEAEEVEKYDELFWSFSTNKFLPHGTENDSEEYYKYLLITAKNQNINNSEILIAKQEVSDELAQQFKKVIYVFDEDNNSAKIFKAKYESEKLAKPKNTKFWLQDEKGKWSNQ